MLHNSVFPIGEPRSETQFDQIISTSYNMTDPRHHATSSFHYSVFNIYIKAGHKKHQNIYFNSMSFNIGYNTAFSHRFSSLPSAASTLSREDRASLSLCPLTKEDTVACGLFYAPKMQATIGSYSAGLAALKPQLNRR